MSRLLRTFLAGERAAHARPGDVGVRFEAFLARGLTAVDGKGVSSADLAAVATLLSKRHARAAAALEEAGAGGAAARAELLRSTASVALPLVAAGAFSAGEGAELLHALSRAPCGHVLAGLREASEALAAALPELQPRGLALVANACARLRLASGPLLERLPQRAAASLREADAPALAGIAHALAKMKLADGAAVRALDLRLPGVLPEMGPADAARVLFAVARLSPPSSRSLMAALTGGGEQEPPARTSSCSATTWRRPTLPTSPPRRPSLPYKHWIYCACGTTGCCQGCWARFGGTPCRPASSASPSTRARGWPRHRRSPRRACCRCRRTATAARGARLQIAVSSLALLLFSGGPGRPAAWGGPALRRWPRLLARAAAAALARPAPGREEEQDKEGGASPHVALSATVLLPPTAGCLAPAVATGDGRHLLDFARHMHAHATRSPVGGLTTSRLQAAVQSTVRALGLTSGAAVAAEEPAAPFWLDVVVRHGSLGTGAARAPAEPKRARGVCFIMGGAGAGTVKPILGDIGELESGSALTGENQSAGSREFFRCSGTAAAAGPVALAPGRRASAASTGQYVCSDELWYCAFVDCSLQETLGVCSCSCAAATTGTSSSSGTPTGTATQTFMPTTTTTTRIAASITSSVTTASATDTEAVTSAASSTTPTGTTTRTLHTEELYCGMVDCGIPEAIQQCPRTCTGTTSRTFASPTQLTTTVLAAAAILTGSFSLAVSEPDGLARAFERGDDAVVAAFASGVADVLRVATPGLVAGAGPAGVRVSFVVRLSSSEGLSVQRRFLQAAARLESLLALELAKENFAVLGVSDLEAAVEFVAAAGTTTPSDSVRAGAGASSELLAVVASLVVATCGVGAFTWRQSRSRLRKRRDGERDASGHGVVPVVDCGPGLAPLDFTAPPEDGVDQSLPQPPYTSRMGPVTERSQVLQPPPGKDLAGLGRG
ncbi:unnamed protein product [Prorocentrum cordatum]|uniref:Uncharacterized protein n=1 Tax=Prorocentrum cordatum TaxID=2364126 RepID=A0ABN9USI0_9DINO|nr:unnamed protein product [Polarella glacialis]